MCPQCKDCKKKLPKNWVMLILKMSRNTGNRGTKLRCRSAASTHFMDLSPQIFHPLGVLALENARIPRRSRARFRGDLAAELNQRSGRTPKLPRTRWQADCPDEVDVGDLPPPPRAQIFEFLVGNHSVIPTQRHQKSEGGDPVGELSGASGVTRHQQTHQKSAPSRYPAERAILLT